MDESLKFEENRILGLFQKFQELPKSLQGSRTEPATASYFSHSTGAVERKTFLVISRKVLLTISFNVPTAQTKAAEMYCH